ncbi:RagB/SusD family nutrient uptake outer membrane protein [uncultured Draconibacterium sp.]|uniref:RagB/SusD family nutrient uptake outer membrane protein n=1 Tax=uncultured Draconibacterium sp. TaxID=1573823 RepID=UPI0025F8247A|nr:RagB/SusD family nutrient uptake outer membrane protein [uncultured Draconibacterium sp.]
MKLYKLFILIIVMTGFMSCEDYLEKYPLDAPSSATFPGSEDELIIAVNGAYNGLHYNKWNWGYSTNELFFRDATDESFNRAGANGIGAEVMGDGTPTSSLYSTAWQFYYGTIQRTNFIIGNMERARETIDAAVCDNAEAEAKFIRAWSYMYLTELFGDVPLITSTITLEESKTPRTPKSQIVDLLLSDLDYGISVLPEEYGSEDNGRITKGAALALKARIALFNGMYNDAATAAKMVMDMDDVYELHPSYTDLFQNEGRDNKEAILKLSFHIDVMKNRNSVIMNSRKGQGWSLSVPTKWLVDSYLCTDGLPIDESPLYDPANPYENRDSRLKGSLYVPGTWIREYRFETHPDSTTTVYKGARVNNVEVTNPYATFTGYLWKKNNDERTFDEMPVYTGTDMPYSLIRYAEVFLIYAEAKIELNQIDQSVYDAINMVRNRADMPDVTPGLSQDELRKVLRNERKIELAGEGLRTFDIRRWKIAEHVIPGKLPGRKFQERWFNPGIPTINEYGHPVYADQDDVFKVIQVRAFDASKNYLWPIPQKEMDVNDQLVQNPGY